MLFGVKTLDDIKHYIERFTKDFNESGFFEYMIGNYRPDGYVEK